jgi:hypothetical protein
LLHCVLLQQVHCLPLKFVKQAITLMQLLLRLWQDLLLGHHGATPVGA